MLRREGVLGEAKPGRGPCRERTSNIALHVVHFFITCAVPSHASNIPTRTFSCILCQDIDLAWFAPHLQFRPSKICTDNNSEETDSLGEGHCSILTLLLGHGGEVRPGRQEGTQYWGGACIEISYHRFWAFFGLCCLFGPFRQKRRLFGSAATKTPLV